MDNWIGQKTTQPNVFFVNAAKMVPRSSSREVRIRVPVLCSLF